MYIDYYCSVQFSSVVQSCPTLCNPMNHTQHTRLPGPSPTAGVYPNPRPSSRWCHPTISSSVIPFSSCPHSPQHQGLFKWVSSLHQVAKVLEFQLQHQNTQDWSPLGWTGWISLQSKGLSRVFFNNTVQKHQFFSAQLSSQSNSHIPTWPLENHTLA